MEIQKFYEKLEKFPKDQLVVMIASLEGIVSAFVGEDEARKIVTDLVESSANEIESEGLKARRV